jgi:hypothetical protein
MSFFKAHLSDLDADFQQVQRLMCLEALTSIIEPITQADSKLMELKIEAVVTPILYNVTTQENKKITPCDLHIFSSLKRKELSKLEELEFVFKKVDAVFKEAIEHSLKTSAFFTGLGSFSECKIDFNLEIMMQDQNQERAMAAFNERFRCKMSAPFALSAEDLI